MTLYVLDFADIGKDDVQRCGGKGANLGELARAGVRVPPGFCIVAGALSYVLESASLVEPIAEIAGRLDFDDASALEAETARIRELIVEAPVPIDLESEILDRYRTLSDGGERYVAVRSSVAIENSPISSFPGMMDTYHYVLGESEALTRIRECWASLWTARAAFARHAQGIAHDRGIIAPVVQVMIDADAAGVLFTANPVSKRTSELVVESNWGIGESVVSGVAMSDFFTVDKTTLTVAESRIGRKNVMVKLDDARGSGRVEREVPPELARQPTLSDAQLIELAATGLKIQQHFGFEADIEWAYEAGVLYILQARRIRDLAADDVQANDMGGA
jgi:pyruvate,water dikinase